MTLKPLVSHDKVVDHVEIVGSTELLCFLTMTVDKFIEVMVIMHTHEWKIQVVYYDMK